MNCNECDVLITRKNHGAHGLCGACNARRHRRENNDMLRQRDKDRWATRREQENERRKRHYEAHKVEHLANSKEYHRVHAEEIRQQQAGYRDRNRKQIREHNRAYNQAKRDRTKELARLQAWAEQEPREKRLERIRAARQRRVARKNELPATLTRLEWQAIKDGFDHRCVYCNRQMLKLTQDHIIPLIDGGPYTADNIVPACLSCNSRKNKRAADVFLLEMPHFSYTVNRC
jgi:hypothetical protein